MSKQEIKSRTMTYKIVITTDTNFKENQFDHAMLTDIPEILRRIYPGKGNEIRSYKETSKGKVMARIETPKQ